MKIGIVGGTGNISTSIVNELLKKGHDVFCFNRGINGIVPEGAHSIIGDRNDQKLFEKSMQDEAFDFAIDMVCMNAEQASSSIRAFNGVKHFIMCSTISTYGVEHDTYPITEDHPLRPVTDYGRNKADADEVFIDAYKKNGFPVTIIKPSTTYGPKMGLLRQVSADFSWIDRIRKGKPILICDDGSAKCQFMHVDDAALVFSSLLGKEECIGEVYNLVDKIFYTWKEYHEIVMKVIGKKVELIEVPFTDLEQLKIPRFGLCRDYFSYDLHFSSEKLFKILPNFLVKISLENGIKEIIKEMDEDGRIRNSYHQKWEDRIILKKRKGTIKSGILINTLLFNCDKIIYAVKKRLLKLLRV